MSLQYGSTAAEQFNMDLRTTDPAQDGFNYWGSGTVSLGNANNFSLVPGRYDNNQKNEQDKEYIAYLWTSVPGYSAFGSYIGNGNADGPFVYCGFRPAFVLVKATNTAADWYITDTTVNNSNPCDNYFIPNGTGVEGTFTHMDILSNGFKIRVNTSNWNQDGITHIYAAFAENPFQSPTTAR